MLKVLLCLQKLQLQFAFEHLNGHRGRVALNGRRNPKEETKVSDIV